MNLLSNALDAVEPQEGLIRVVCHYDAENRQSIIEVIDNGTGIPETMMKHMFELFHSTKGNRGTGLGLAVAKKIVEEHEGSISVQPAGEGTTFTIRLPVYHETLADPSHTHGPARVGARSSFSRPACGPSTVRSRSSYSVPRTLNKGNTSTPSRVSRSRRPSRPPPGAAATFLDSAEVGLQVDSSTGAVRVLLARPGRTPFQSPIRTACCGRGREIPSRGIRAFLLTPAEKCGASHAVGTAGVFAPAISASVGMHVPERGGAVTACRRDLPRPPRDHRHADAALVHVPLEAAEPARCGRT